MFGSFPRRAAGGRISRRALLRLDELEQRTTPTVNVLSTFPGMNYRNAPGSVPPDTIAASGATEIIETVNTDIAIYNKSGTAILQPTSLGTFFQSLHPSSFLSDSYAGYDELNGTFFVSVLSLSTDIF